LNIYQDLAILHLRNREVNTRMKIGLKIACFKNNVEKVKRGVET